jgi:D-hydroxyproline dehydrogenase subunit alpha
MIDLLVIGAGPAGLAAARTAGELGLRVVVADENPTAGGQYYRLPALPGATPDRRQAEGRVAIERAVAVAQLRLGCSVVALEPAAGGLRAWLDRAGELVWVSPRVVLLATGAYDTPVAFPGWTLPGVMSAGAAQALVKGQRVRPGRRAVVAGSGPFVFAVADTLRHAGVSIVEVVEAAPMRRAARHLPTAIRHLGRLRELAGYALPLIVRGTGVRTGQVIAAAEGVDRLEAVRIRGRGAPGAPGTSASAGRVVEADLLCVGYGFSASTELARLAGASLAQDAGLGQLVPAADAWQMTSRPGLFIAGEASGLGGAAVAEAEGELAAIGAARHVGRLDEAAAATAAAPVRGRLAGLRDFAALLPRIFPRPDELGYLADPDTLVCRCENVSLGTVLAAVEQGRVGSLNELKSTTRCGQGWCQGRICGAVLPAVISAHHAGFDAVTPWTARVPIRPVGLAAIAAQVRDGDARDASKSTT